MTAYERIVDLCRKKGIAQTKLEKELGFSRGSIGKSKQHEMTHARLQKIADYFAVSVDYLMGVSDIPHKIDSPVLKAAEKRWKLYNDELSKLLVEHEFLKFVSPTHEECDLILAFRKAPGHIQQSILTMLQVDTAGNEELKAAHERTDIETNSEMKQHDYNIMKGDDF